MAVRGAGECGLIREFTYKINDRVKPCPVRDYQRRYVTADFGKKGFHLPLSKNLNKYQISIIKNIERKEKNMRGLVHKYKDNVNTDEIIPARYLNDSAPAALAAHCMEDIDKAFVGAVKAGDIIVAEKNFGCGSSREHAPIAIKASGVSCVIACDFARIFFRNAINIGLPILECPEAAKDAENGDEIEVDLAKGTIKNITKGKSYSVPPFPKEIRDIIARGGLLNK